MRILPALLLAALLPACSPAPPENATLDRYSGRWLVINYWAAWCKPCIEEIPELNRLDRIHADVVVIGVNFDGVRGEELDRQVRELGVAFPVLAVDPAAELGVARPVVLPTTLLVDPAGELRQTLVGPQTLESLTAALGKKNRPMGPD